MIELTDFHRKADQLIAAGRFLFSQGWSPATSSNYSARLDERHLAITISGRHKGRLAAGDIMAVDLDGQPAMSHTRPSAETLLHCVVYAALPDVGAVVHTHSVTATRLGMRGGDSLRFSGYEMQKAIAGTNSHEGELVLPIYDNTQDIPALAAQTRIDIAAQADIPGYLIRGHGLYTWGRDIDEALRHVEALEFLMECRLMEEAGQ